MSDKRYFYCRLNPPRATFSVDMTDAERAMMNEHVAYWTRLAGEGTAIAFGPVADPRGGWGVGILAVDDEAHLDRLHANDPTIRARAGFHYEVYPMPVVIHG